MANQPPPVSIHVRALRNEPSGQRNDNSTNTRLSSKIIGSVGAEGADAERELSVAGLGETVCLGSAKLPARATHSTAIDASRIRSPPSHSAPHAMEKIASNAMPGSFLEANLA